MSVKLRKRKTPMAPLSFTWIYKIMASDRMRSSNTSNWINLQTFGPAGQQGQVRPGEKIELKRAQVLSASDYSMVTDTGKKTVVTAWMQNYVDKYTKKDNRNINTYIRDSKAPCGCG